MFLKVAYETPVNVKSIAIFETYHAGAVTKVSLKNPSGQWEEVYSGSASDIKRARAFKPTLKVCQHTLHAIQTRFNVVDSRYLVVSFFQKNSEKRPIATF